MLYGSYSMLAFESSLATNLFLLVETIGVVSSLLFTAHTVRAAEKSQRLTNLFSLTSYHRQIWMQLFTKPELRRVMNPSVDVHDQDITEEERLFVKLLILHLSTTYQATELHAVVPIEGLEKDVASFISLPIPYKVWSEISRYQNRDFVRFVQKSLC